MKVLYKQNENASSFIGAHGENGGKESHPLCPHCVGAVKDETYGQFISFSHI